jgi:hypothetical protein
MSSTSLVPGAIIYHILSKDYQYMILSVKKDIKWHIIFMYSFKHKIIFDNMIVKDNDVWNLVVK